MNKKISVRLASRSCRLSVQKTQLAEVNVISHYKWVRFLRCASLKSMIKKKKEKKSRVYPFKFFKLLYGPH